MPGRSRTAGFRAALARARSSESGFTILETTIAMGVIFVSLVSFAFVAVNGFRYVALGRERQAANQIANHLMEEIRGFAFSKVQQGLNSSEVTAADPYIADCGAEGLQFSLSDTCPGEDIVQTAGLESAYPLVAHTGTFPESLGYPVEYTWRTYVTNGDPAIEPYKVTVVVAWDGPFQGVAGNVVSQSLFWSPAGCVSSQTHPFAAPCQAFFFGQGSSPQGRIDVTAAPGGPGVEGTTFQQGSLVLAGANANIQDEQVSQVQGSFQPISVSLTDADGTQSSGATVPLTTAADGDPAGGAPTYSKAPEAGSFVGTGGSVNTGTGTTVVFTAGDGDTGESVSTVAASFDCPTSPPALLAESDKLPCGGSRVRQIGLLEAYADLQGTTPLGRTLLASVAGVGDGQDATVFADRIPVSGSVGNHQQAVERTLGLVRIGGLPEGMTIDPAAYPGFTSFFELEGYADRATATAGPSAPAPVGEILGGTVRYWNGTSYTEVDPTAGFAVDTRIVGTVGTSEVVVTLAGTANGALITTEGLELPGGGWAEGTASVFPPLAGAFAYTVSVDGIAVVNVTLSVDLGAIVARTSYQPAPTAG